jgi:hypothetical protein
MYKKHKKPLIHYESTVYFLRVVEVTAMQQLTAKSCKSLQAATQFSLL